MKFNRTLSVLLAIVIAFGLLSGCAANTPGSSDPSNGSVSNNNTSDKGLGFTASELRIAIQPSAAYVPLYLVKEKGWLEEALAELGVTVKWTEFESGPPINESFAAGQQDIGVIGDVPTITALATGQPNTVIGISGYGVGAYSVLVPTDSDITSPAQLKGKTIGLPIGTTAHNLTDKVLAKNGLDINTDVKLVNLSVGDLQSALKTKQVDAVAVWEPTITRLSDSGTAKILADGTGVLRGVNTIFGRTEYLKANPEIVKIFLEQYARGNKELRENTKSATEAVATKYFTLEPEQLQRVVEKYDYPVEITDADITELESTINFLLKIDAISKKVDLSSAVDRSYAKSADLAQYAVS